MLSVLNDLKNYDFLFRIGVRVKYIRDFMNSNPDIKERIPKIVLFKLFVTYMAENYINFTIKRCFYISDFRKYEKQIKLYTLCGDSITNIMIRIIESKLIDNGINKLKKYYCDSKVTLI